MEVSHLPGVLQGKEATGIPVPNIDQQCLACVFLFILNCCSAVWDLPQGQAGGYPAICGHCEVCMKSVGIALGYNYLFHFSTPEHCKTTLHVGKAY